MKSKLSSKSKRRLLKLADLLEKDARNKKGMVFDLGLVGQASAGRYEDPEWEPELKCNTAGCAIGLACISGAFKKQGLTYTIVNSEIVPVFKHRRYFGVADKAFFELNEKTHNWLFTPWSYKDRVGAKSEKAVAGRIRRYVAGKGTPDVWDKYSRFAKPDYID